MRRLLRPARVFTTLASLSLIAACVAEDTEAPLRENAEALLFGEDDRVDYYEVEDEAWRALMRESIAAVVPTDAIDASDPEDIRINAESLQTRMALCDGEPFIDQPSGAACTAILVADEFALLDGCAAPYDPAGISAMSLVFDYRYTRPGTLETITSEDVYEVVAQWDVSNDALGDFLFDSSHLVQLDRAVDEQRRPVVLSERVPEIGDALVLIGHSQGLPMKFDAGGELRSIDAIEGAPFPLGGAWGISSDIFASQDSETFGLGFGVFNRDLELIASVFRQPSTNPDGLQWDRELECGRLWFVDEDDEEATDAFAYRHGVQPVKSFVLSVCSIAGEGEGAVARLSDTFGCEERFDYCEPCDAELPCGDGFACADYGPDGVGRCVAECAFVWECDAESECVDGLCLGGVPVRPVDRTSERVCLENDAYLPNSCGTYSLEESCGEFVCVTGQFFPCVGEALGDSCDSAPVVDVFSSGLNGRFERSPDQARHRDLFGGLCGGDGVDQAFTFTIEDPTSFRAIANTPDVRLGLRGECGDDWVFACSRVIEDASGAVLEASLEPGTYFLVAESLNDFVEQYAVAFDSALNCPCELGAVVCDGREVLTCVEGPAECPVLSRQACADEQACVEGACVTPRAGDLCADAVAVELGSSETVRVTSLGFGDDTAASCGDGGGDAVHAVVVEELSRLEAAVVGEPGLSLSLRASCGDAESELACAAGGQTLSAEVEAGTYFIWVEGVTQDYTLSVDATPSCTDECSGADAEQCDGEGAVRVCGQFDDDSCLELGPATPCADGAVCVDATGCIDACAATCTEGETRCDGETVEECVVDESGCTAFVTMDVCSAAGCAEGACVEAAEVSLCEDGSAPPCEEPRDAVSGGCAASGRAPAATWALLIGLGALVRRRM